MSRDALAARFSVVVDATFGREDQRDAFLALAAQAGVACHIVAFEAPLPVLRERVRERERHGADVSEADVAVLDAQCQTAQPLRPHEEAITLHVDTTRPVDWNTLLTAARKDD